MDIAEELDKLRIKFKEILTKAFAPGNKIVYKNKLAIIISADIVERNKTEELPDGRVEEYPVVEASKIKIKLTESEQVIEIIEPLDDPDITFYLKED